MKRSSKLSAATITTVVAVAAMVLNIIFVTQYLRHEHSAMIEQDYRTCLVANDFRAAARAQMDFSANPNPVDPNLIQNPELRLVIIGQEARGAQFRQEWAPKFAPRDCDSERTAAGG